MIPDRLYHYTTKEIAIEKILGEGKIRLGLYGQTNDPRETKFWWHEVNDLDYDKLTSNLLRNVSGLYEVAVILGEVNRIKQGEWKVLCLSQHHPKFTQESKFKEAYSGYSHSRMWAQYAGNHSGICLEFNGPRLNENINEALDNQHKIFSGSVIYGDIESIPTPVITDAAKQELRQFCLRNYEDLFLRKTKEWESETEYRWLVYSQDTDPKYVPIGSSIISVIAGVDFPRVYESALIPLCSKYKIPAGNLIWQNGRPTLNRASIYDPNKDN